MKLHFLTCFIILYLHVKYCQVLSHNTIIPYVESVLAIYINFISLVGEYFLCCVSVSR